MNRPEDFERIFDGVRPWAGNVPRGFGVDFVGTFTDARFRVNWRGNPSSIGGRFLQTRVPTLVDPQGEEEDHAFEVGNWNGERWFEAVDWFAAARAARDRFVMVTLGAWHGSQAIGSARALQLVNPMPYKLVAVDPVPENIVCTRLHMANNGIDPDAQWLIPLAISDRNDPLFFALGPREMGSQNCFSTNEKLAREDYLRDFIQSGQTQQALENLLLHGTTGIKKPGAAGETGTEIAAEIKYVSSITMGDVLGPLDVVDYLESDIQESEILVFPPFIDLLRRKVRRIHIGTHGQRVHVSLHDLFVQHGWEIVFSYEPETEHHTSLGSFKTGDGVLTVVNPKLVR
jgi:hypothetical protein